MPLCIFAVSRRLLHCQKQILDIFRENSSPLTVDIQDKLWGLSRISLSLLQ